LTRHKIAVIGTGGTISSVATSSLDTPDYPEFGQKLTVSEDTVFASAAAFDLPRVDVVLSYAGVDGVMVEAAFGVDVGHVCRVTIWLASTMAGIAAVAVGTLYGSASAFVGLLYGLKAFICMLVAGNRYFEALIAVALVLGVMPSFAFFEPILISTLAQRGVDARAVCQRAVRAALAGHGGDRRGWGPYRGPSHRTFRRAIHPRCHGRRRHPFGLILRPARLPQGRLAGEDVLGPTVT